MLRTPRNLLAAGLVATLGAGLLAGCSSSTSSSSSTSTAAKAACKAPAGSQGAAVELADAQPNPGITSDYDLTSFDGTVIRVHWFANPKASEAKPLPTVLMGPGWGFGGDTAVASTGILGSTSIGGLWKAGFNVVTWDPRGFGASGGKAEVDSPDYEGRDVSAIISWVAKRPGVELEASGDPRMGMVGGSYGGGIQFVTAAADCRVDAIAPTIAWHSLTTSLAKNAAPKTGWDGILMAVAAGRPLDEHVTSANAYQLATGRVREADLAWFAARGPDKLLGQVHVPTLILQGTVDGLFTLQEGIDNYNALKAKGTTVAMAWFCGGHGSCLTNPGKLDAGELSVAWMRRYVAGERDVAVPTGLSFVDQDGVTWHASSWPLRTTPLNASGSGTLELVAGGGSVTPDPKGQLASAKSAVDSVAMAVTPGPAAKAVEVPISFTRTEVVAGVPRLKLSYSGPAQAGATRPARIFAQLVDPATGLVLGNQITPIPLTLDGKVHQLSLPLEAIVFSAKPGSKVVLQLTASSNAYATGQLGGQVDLRRVEISLPVASGVTRTATP